jgi:hypothetical protein
VDRSIFCTLDEGKGIDKDNYCLSLFALVASMVAQRTREIGIRIAL